MEMQILIEDFKIKQSQLEKITSVVGNLTMQVEIAEKLLFVEGVGFVTVVGFLAEVGDISRFKALKQI